MQIINFPESCHTLKDVIDQVIADADVTVIARRDAPNAVVMSYSHYSSLMETVHLLSSPTNAEHLITSIEQFLSSDAKQRDLVMVATSHPEETSNA